MAGSPFPDRKYRAPFGIFEAGLLLVVVGMAAWATAPVGRARRAAAAEREVLEVLAAVADALDARAAGPAGPGRRPLSLASLLAASPALAERVAASGFRPSEDPEVLGNGVHWITVLLPGKDGRVGPASAADPASRARGFVVLAWPREEGAGVLRALAALPDGVMWQHLDEKAGRAGPSDPPIPAVAFGDAPDDPRRGPPAPPDWTPTRPRKR